VFDGGVRGRHGRGFGRQCLRPRESVTDPGPARLRSGL
jgi:hypothetical protein